MMIKNLKKPCLIVCNVIFFSPSECFDRVQKRSVNSLNATTSYNLNVSMEDILWNTIIG